MGFVTPEAIWLEQGRAHVEEVLAEPTSGDYLDTDALRARLAERAPAGGKPVFYTDLFRWYILELWMRQQFSTPRAFAHEPGGSVSGADLAPEATHDN
jgi:hypothetical protein